MARPPRQPWSTTARATCSTSTDPLGNTTTNTYDANRNLLSTTDPLGHTTSYTYDANGNKTSTTYPATATSTNTTSTTNYNQYSEPTSTTDELGNTRTFNYDANYNPQSVTDSVGTLMSTQFNADGPVLAGAIGYDITQTPCLRLAVHLRRQRQPGREDRRPRPHHLLHLQLARPEDLHDRAHPRRLQRRRSHHHLHLRRLRQPHRDPGAARPHHLFALTTPTATRPSDTDARGNTHAIQVRPP